MIRPAHLLPRPTRRTAHNLLYALLLTLLLLTGTSCEQSDDISTIFESSGWSFTGFCYTANWDKGDCKRLNIDYEGKDTYPFHFIVFGSGGAADISMPGCSLTAHWKADGVTRSFALTDIRVVTGSLNDLSPFSRKFYDELTEATWYRGDANALQLFNADEHYYLLFSPMRKE